jgi:NYN domain
MPITTVRRTALFVDFDNVYIGLRDLDEQAAEVFARDPGRLVAWLENGEDVDGPFRRRFLVRVCYLNPEPFSQFRPFYTVAGFRVVDTPSLTRQGKSAADTHVVIDVLDTLAHPVHCDEFVICASDADYAPLMVRLRANDRRTMMVTASPSSRAYRAVCDEAVEPATFIAGLLAASAHPATAAPRASAIAAPPDVGEPPKQVAEAVSAVLRLVDGSDAPVRASEAAKPALVVMPELKPAWAGTGSFHDFVSRYLPKLHYVADDSGGWVIDPRRHSRAELPAALQPETLPAQVSRVTGAPDLNSSQYAVLFEELAKDVTEHGFSLTSTTRNVRDRAIERDVSIARNAVGFVVQGLPRVKVDLRQGRHTAKQLAAAWTKQVLNMADDVRMQLSDADRQEIHQWIEGALP